MKLFVAAAALALAGSAAVAPATASVPHRSWTAPPTGEFKARSIEASVSYDDLISDGTALPPSKPQAAPRALPNVARPIVPVNSYVHDAWTLRSLPHAALPYWGETTPRVDTRPHDATGVRMFEVDGTLYNHPVAQAEYGLANLSRWGFDQAVVGGDTFFLDRAIAQAQRLIDTKVLSGNGWYYPYLFDFALHGRSTDVLRAPWYSGMAEGMALSLFSRLATATGDGKWRDAADHTFISLEQARATGLPSVVRVDASRHLWFDEYPSPDASKIDLTYNGHTFAAFGVYDYWQLSSGDNVAAAAAAAVLLNGALRLVRDYAGSFRNVNWQSKYCLLHRVDAGHYHQIHVGQLLYAQSFTGAAVYARASDQFRADYPRISVSGTVIMTAGSRSAYTFGAQGNVLSAKTIHLSRTSSAPATSRARIKGRAVYYQISAGSLKNYWIREIRGSIYLRAQAATSVYDPARSAHLRGTYRAYTFNTDYTVSRAKQVSFARTSNAPFDSSAYIDAVLYLHMTAGSFANMWLPITNVSTD